MSDFIITGIVYLALAAHIVVGVVAWRRFSTLPLVPVLNFIMAFGVLVYWVQRWYDALTKGIKLDATDQLLPAYATLVCILSVLFLAGKITTSVPNWIVFVLHLLAVEAALLFMLNFKITRLI